MSTLEIRQHKSAIGEKTAAKGTLQALGLGRPGSTVTHEDTVTVRGMLRRVKHLVIVRSGEGPSPAGAPAPATGQAAAPAEEKKR